MLKGFILGQESKDSRGPRFPGHQSLKITCGRQRTTSDHPNRNRSGAHPRAA